MLRFDDLHAALRARDAVLAAWRAGSMGETAARERLAAIAAVDADGHWWRLRPDTGGALFVRLSPAGDVEVRDPADYQPPTPTPPGWVRAATRVAVGAWAAVWLAVLASVLRGG
jgi:hypothetical protein